MVWGWFNCITFTVHFISVIITPAPPQIIRYKILEAEEPCKVLPMEGSLGMAVGPIYSRGEQESHTAWGGVRPAVRWQFGVLCQQGGYMRERKQEISQSLKGVMGYAFSQWTLQLWMKRETVWYGRKKKKIKAFDIQKLSVQFPGASHNHCVTLGACPHYSLPLFTHL